MRFALIGAVFLNLTTFATAQTSGVVGWLSEKSGGLRGSNFDSSPNSQPITVGRWDGSYIGIWGGLSTMAYRTNGWFTGAPFEQITQDKYSYGIFYGKNVQLDNNVYGVEFDLSRSANNKKAISSTSSFTDTGSAEISNTYRLSHILNADILASIKFKAGYAWGDFLFYGTAGISGGLGSRFAGDISIIDQRNYTEAGGVRTYTTSTQTITRPNHFNVAREIIYGYNFGLGAEYLITQNVFLRGRYQFTRLGHNGTNPFYLHTVEGGVGLKF